MTHDEMIEVLQAAKDGKTIQWFKPFEGKWYDCIVSPSWDFSKLTYRVKRDPREWWINVYANGEFWVYQTKTIADKNAGDARLECVHVRDVIE